MQAYHSTKHLTNHSQAPPATTHRKARQVYATESQMTGLLAIGGGKQPTDPSELDGSMGSFSTICYNNRIFDLNAKHKVQKLARTSAKSNYQSYHDSHQVFVKPYAEHTQYVDTLQRNSSLLRRGPFDLPLPVNASRSRPMLEKYSIAGQSKPGKFCRKVAHKYSQPSQQLASMTRNINRNEFDNSIAAHLEHYDELLGRQRTNKSHSISMSNTINRLLAAEMISCNLRAKVQSKMEKRL